MKHLLIVLLFAMAISVRGDELPPELKSMRESYQLELEKATGFVRSKYVAALEKLLKSYLRDGNLEGAIAAKGELEKLQGSKWAGRWSFGPFIMTILPEGRFIESNQNGTTNDEGKWTNDKNETLQLVFNNGHKCVAVMHKGNRTATGNVVPPSGAKYVRSMKRLEE